MKKILFYILIVFLAHKSFSQTQVVYLVAEMGKTHTLDDMTIVEMWGYGHVKAELPGPILYFNLGDTAEVHFANLSAEPHTIHFHGLDVSQYEDGVPATSYWVPYNDSTIYNFVTNHAGSYLYHCHVMTTLHLTMGMYGVVVVKNFPEQNLIYSGGPSYQKEHVFLATDMDRSINENPTTLGGPIHLMDLDYFMINGLSGIPLLTDPDHQVYAYPGDSILLRLSSLGYSKTRFIFPEELNAIAYMSDGRALPAPHLCDTLMIHPGERYEVLLTPTTITQNPIQVEYYDIRNNTLEHINFISVNSDLGVSVETKNQPILSVYPNPATDSFNFVVSEIGNDVVIYNVVGEIIYQNKIQYFETTIQSNQFNAGIYFVVYNGQMVKLIIS